MGNLSYDNMSDYISIIVPVFNEEKTISEIIKRIKGIDFGEYTVKKEIIVVDDGSYDESRKIILNEKGIKLFFHNKNIGKGGAIKTGIKNSKGDIIVIQDADLEYNPIFIPKMLYILKKKNSDAVYGSRFLGKMEGKKILVHMFGNYFLTFFTSFLFRKKITDMETGQKMFKAKIIKSLNIKATGFEFEPEVTAKLIKNNYTIYEIPIYFKARGFSEGKKITWADGIKAAWVLLAIRFGFYK